LNNPLQAILGFAELLQMQQDMPDQARADLTLIQKESARASAIIRNLSRFGGRCWSRLRCACWTSWHR
jgi:signal transduction histidine kinase